MLLRSLLFAPGIFQGSCTSLTCKARVHTLYLFLHVHRHFTLFLCQDGNEQMFFMCKENMSDTEISQGWQRRSRAHTEFLMTEFFQNTWYVLVKYIAFFSGNFYHIWTPHHSLSLLHPVLFTKQLKVLPTCVKL